MSAHPTVETSRTTMTELVLPEDTNAHGNVFGGRLLALADKCAAIVAFRHCRAAVVTASFDRVDFLRPVREGMIVILSGEMTAAFRTSVEVLVTVDAEDPLSGERETTCRALVTLVAVDAAGRPLPVPPLALVDDEQERRAQRAAERRAQRLATRGQI